MRSIETCGMIVIGLLVASVLGANGLAEDRGKRTASTVIRDDMLVASDRELRQHVEEIVFVYGVVEYDRWVKNPVCRLTASYGMTYACMGIEKYAGHEVILAAVPRLQTLSTGPSDPVRAVKRVYFVQPRVIAAEVPRGSVDKLGTTREPATIQGEPGRKRATWNKIDSEEFSRVHQVADLVVRRSEELWVELVEHLDDGRYCMTVGIDAGYPRNCSVGDICQTIIGETLSAAYYDNLPGTKEDYHRFNIPAFAKDKLKLREWCLARKDRKLFELQIEACALAITEIKASDMGLEEKQRITTAIKKEIDGLTKSRVAIPCPSAF